MRTLREQLSNRCKHFTGLQELNCKAGVNYHQLMGDGPGCFAHIPCLKDEQSKVICTSAKFPTEEEVTEEIKMTELGFQKVILARQACAEDAHSKGWGKHRQGGAAKIVCPICQGQLTYSIAAVNGHIHAKCSTTGCVSWIE